MTTLETSVARKDFSSVIKAAKKGERFLFKRHGKEMAALVSVSDLARLRAVEDAFDRDAADAALRDYEEQGAIPWEDVKASLGL
jgi:prevent-host-death family protein